MRLEPIVVVPAVVAIAIAVGVRAAVVAVDASSSSTWLQVLRLRPSDLVSCKRESTYRKQHDDAHLAKLSAKDRK
jgi:hypothetical protein